MDFSEFSDRALQYAARVAKEFNGYTGLKHIQLGSTAEMVVRHASCPVLVLPNPDRQSTL